MNSSVYLPADEFGGIEPPNLDLAADYLELKAVFSTNGQSFSADIVDALEFAANAPFDDVDAELKVREEVAKGAVSRMNSRKQALAQSYPFEFDERDRMVLFKAAEPSLGQAAYLISLLLSNLRAVTPLLEGSQYHPSDAEVRRLRTYFQYFATAAIAAEIGGQAWSFGFPRPDGTGFSKKLREIWNILRDGTIGFHPSAPPSPKDDKVDVFAWREPGDGLPGFLLVAAQVATGRDWKEKSIKGHIGRVFPDRWFSTPPATEMVAYHVIPFARPDVAFHDDVLVLGNVLHRLRVPRRVDEAAKLVRQGVVIEAFDQLNDASDWIRTFVDRGRAA